ncbi:MAG: hypothetical protein R3C56_34650 [Pirellulaceae bacterium]
MRRESWAAQRQPLSLEQGREVSGADPEDRCEAPDQPLLRAEQIAMVHAALDLLSEEHRAILVLREMQDSSYEDDYEILDINIGDCAAGCRGREGSSSSIWKRWIALSLSFRLYDSVAQPSAGNGGCTKYRPRDVGSQWWGARSRRLQP